MIYAGFSPRLRAGIVDGLVFLPFCILAFWAQGHGASTAIAVATMNFVVYYAYSVVGHAKWGKTLGKHFAGVRVRSTTGTPLTWKQSLRRSGVDLLLGTVGAVAYAFVIMRIPKQEFALKGWQEIQTLYDALRPAWVRVLEYSYWVWISSELVTMLFNPQRRALHDFIGGTVVLLDSSPSVEASDSPADVRGAVRLWSILDQAGATVAILVAAFFLAGSLYSASTGDHAAFTGTLAFASYSTMLAGLFSLARRAHARGLRRHRYLRTGAGVLTLLPLLVLI